MTTSLKPQFFATQDAMRTWLERHHRTAPDVFVGYYKRHAVSDSKRSITWAESVAEALCFGWIDGVRKTLDADRYTIRFTPRRSGSRWSAVNIKLIAELESAGKLTDAGRAAFAARKDRDSKGYTAQKKVGAFDEARLRAFKKDKPAWTFFEAQPPGYRKAMAWWVMQAKQEATRDRRLAKVIAASATQQRVT